MQSKVNWINCSSDRQAATNCKACTIIVQSEKTVNIMNKIRQTIFEKGGRDRCECYHQFMECLKPEMSGLHREARQASLLYLYF